ncbi:hypothetical protein MJL48_32850, partial [Salmonella enterica subsp. enterica serovar Kentucky]|nr:hypothetical protein [Salmonella enterica subsp. enterica serovar Kentucky]
QIVSQERCRSEIYIKLVVRSLLDVINRIEELVEAPAMLTQAKIGPSHMAFLVVPMVGAFFIDIVNALVIKLYLMLPIFAQ